ncbi:MAG TPA: tetratricopeptide repeat protein [Roseiflexaceae bacterium]|nr:tetratricopeptide repeat protein [Roseiflexaceae bacterium]
MKQFAGADKEREAFLGAHRADRRVVHLSRAASRSAERSFPDDNLVAAGLPQGTLTFLFTDIERSTRRWEEHPQAMRAALPRHDALLREAVEAHGGVIFKTVGDGIHAVFARPSDALAAALAAQRALVVEPWGAVGPLRVRMALHTGAAKERAGDYFGPPLNRVARLLAAGHGGQVLLSHVTQELIRDELPPDLELRDLGSHRLKDLTYPEHIFQLIAPDLPADFPALRTLTTHQANLPIQPTPLVGREREVAFVRDRLRQDDVRLLTLTGPGGVGKTRLALQVAAEVVDDFSDGVFFVDLASVRDASLVVARIAQVLDVEEVGGQPLLERLNGHLRGKQLLLLLDNFEQVVAAAPLVAELLSGCADLKILITSREVLRLRGEKHVPVSPLALPEPKLVPSPAELTQYAAVKLFIQRAQDARPEFAVTEENASAIAQICVRLDGLPLALELAAARTKLFTPQALLVHLEQHLATLSGGARDLPMRQQTLHDTIGWSFDLLDAGEQLLFRDLAVFVGGCTVEAIEAVCYQVDESPAKLLDALMALIDKSLLCQIEGPDDAPRFTMLEVIRAYALERLDVSGEAYELKRRHMTYYLALAETAAPEITGPQQQAWLDLLEQDHDNVQAALQWALDQRELETALKFCRALWKFWQCHSYYSVGRRWMDAVLAKSRLLRLPVRSQVLCGAGWLAFSQNDNVRASALFDESLALARELHDPCNMAMALHGVGEMAQLQGDYSRARALYDESLALFRELGETVEIAWSLDHLAALAGEQGDYIQALALGEESLASFRQIGHSWGIAVTLRHLAQVAYAQGDLAQAKARYQEVWALLQDLGDKAGLAWALVSLADIAELEGDYARAAALFKKSLLLAKNLRDNAGIAFCLTRLADVAMAQEHFEQAARLLGATEGLFDSHDTQLDPAVQRQWARSVAALRTRLNQATVAAAWAVGRAMSFEQAIAMVLGDDS